ncbi:MAG: hydroxymethylglutaryl-CoA lyase [Peptococcaceae bacterium]
MQWPEKITICEVGPRDGLQNEKTIFTVEQKVQLIESIVEAGVSIVEIGSFVHPKVVPSMANSDEVARRIKRRDGVEYRGLIANLKGAERALAAGINKVKLTVSASESHCRANLNKAPEDIIAGFYDCVEFAAKNGMKVSGAISTAFGCPFEGKIAMEQVEKVVTRFVELGVTELSLSDTTGMANPRQVYNLSCRLKERFSQVQWVFHFHNTRGMALANIIAGMQAGIAVFDSSFAGLGGCPFAPGASGNVATEDVIHMIHEMGIATGVDLDKVIGVARLVREFVNHETESFILKAGCCSDLILGVPK